MKYDYETKKVKIDSNSFDADFPKKHSRISGIVLYTVDENAGDPYANIRRYRHSVYILWKDNTKWECIKDGSFKEHIIYTWSNIGLFGLLYDLETDKEKEKINRKERLAEIKSELPKMLKEYEEMTGKTYKK